MTTEAWRAVRGFQTYRVSNLGRVQSLMGARGQMRLMPRLVKPRWFEGYPIVSLSQCKHGRRGRPAQRFVHRLVLEAFVGPAFPGREASHLNGDRSDPRALNLMWETRARNHRRKQAHGTVQRGERHGRHVLTEDQAREVKRRLVAGDPTRPLAREFGVSRSSVLDIRRGRSWGWLCV